MVIRAVIVKELQTDFLLEYLVDSIKPFITAAIHSALGRISSGLRRISSKPNVYRNVGQTRSHLMLANVYHNE